MSEKGNKRSANATGGKPSKKSKSFYAVSVYQTALMLELL